jgi:hypothetical protein
MKDHAIYGNRRTTPARTTACGICGGKIHLRHQPTAELSPEGLASAGVAIARISGSPSGWCVGSVICYSLSAGAIAPSLIVQVSTFPSSRLSAPDFLRRNSFHVCRSLRFRRCGRDANRVAEKARRGLQRDQRRSENQQVDSRRYGSES